MLTLVVDIAMCLCATIQQVGNQLISDLSDYFDVELINRFSQKYTFSEISRSVYRKIVEKRLASEIKVIKRLHPELNMDSLFSADELAKAVDKITADTYNIKSGARPAITAVSRVHASIEQRAGNWYLKDMNSRNGTWVNEQELYGEEEQELINGDQIRFADLIYQVKI
mgnify:CR=1 FL=1